MKQSRAVWFVIEVKWWSLICKSKVIFENLFRPWIWLLRWWPLPSANESLAQHMFKYVLCWCWFKFKWNRYLWRLENYFQLPKPRHCKLNWLETWAGKSRSITTKKSVRLRQERLSKSLVLSNSLSRIFCVPTKLRWSVPLASHIIAHASFRRGLIYINYHCCPGKIRRELRLRTPT